MEQQYHERLRKYRENARLTQEELAEKINVSRQTVSKWERGEASPDTDNLIKLSSLYQVSVDALLKTDPCQSLEPLKSDKSAAEEPTAEEPRSDDDDDDWDDDDDCEDRGFETPVGRSGREFWLHFPIAVLCTVAFFCLGCFWGYWHPGWIVFLIIPVWEGIVRAIARRNLRRLPVPVITAIVYLILGCCFGLWHPGRIIFLLIPIFEYICCFFS